MLMFLAVAAHAGPAAEEIVVYGDPFARWNGTRWLVETEVVPPNPMRLDRERDEGFIALGMQSHVILACDKEHALSRKAHEIRCAIEDLSLRAVPGERDPSAARIAAMDGVMAELDAKLTGASVQLQVSADGAVRDVGLDGVEDGDHRTADIQETLRLALLSPLAGFHLRLPTAALKDGRSWVEYNSALLTIPSAAGSSGSSELAHYANRVDAGWIVQSIGQATATAPIRNPLADTPCLRTGPENPHWAGCPPGSNRRPEYIDHAAFTATYDLELDGVGLFDPATGYLTERVWAVRGKPAASSPDSERRGATRTLGRLQLLGDADAPALGTSGVARPGAVEADGIAPWALLRDGAATAPR